MTASAEKFITFGMEPSSRPMSAQADVPLMEQAQGNSPMLEYVPQNGEHRELRPKEDSWAPGEESSGGEFKLWSYEPIQEPEPGDTPDSAGPTNNVFHREAEYTQSPFVDQQQGPPESIIIRECSAGTFYDFHGRRHEFDHHSSQGHRPRPVTPGVEVLDLTRLSRAGSEIQMLDLTSGRGDPNGSWAPVTPWGAGEPFSVQRFESEEPKSGPRFVPLEPLDGASGGPRAPNPPNGRRRPQSGNRNRGLYQVHLPDVGFSQENMQSEFTVLNLTSINGTTLSQESLRNEQRGHPGR